jgi:hypothetical protein
VPVEVRRVGACVLLEGKSLFCDPACVSMQTCGDDGACHPTPLGQSVGDVVVTGARTAAGASEIRLEATTTFQYQTNATLAEPPFDPGAPVSLTASGMGSVAAFALRGEGLAPLDVPDVPIKVEASKALSLGWTPPPSPTKARVEIKLQFNLHGATTAAYLECSADDTGAFDVPAEMIDELLSRELSGFPTLTMTRRTADSVSIGAGCVDFSVSSRVSRELEVPGIKSCAGV